MRITSPNITELKDNEIFVFGSNLSGIHGGGAAKTALNKFGAVYGNPIGIQGNSYAIPTKDETVRRALSVDEVKGYVDQFIRFAKNSPELHFLVTEIGCGLAGFTVDQMAPLFKEAKELDNVWLPERFLNKM